MATALFVCLHNAGRSQMSQALFERAADGRHRALSAGTTPAERVHPEVIEVMRELGIDLADRTPRKLTRELAEQADVVVTMGCGDECPYVPGRRYLEWELDDPKGRPIEEVRAMRDEIAVRVRELVTELDAASLPTTEHGAMKEVPDAPSRETQIGQVADGEGSMQDSTLGEQGRDSGDIDWSAIEDSPEFQELVRRRRAFLVPATIAFLGVFLTYLVLAAFAPGVMGTQIADGLPLAWLAAMAQVLLTWIVAWAYLRHADRVLEPLERRAADAAREGSSR